MTNNSSQINDKCVNTYTVIICAVWTKLPPDKRPTLTRTGRDAVTGTQAPERFDEQDFWSENLNRTRNSPVSGLVQEGLLVPRTDMDQEVNKGIFKVLVEKFQVFFSLDTKSTLT